MVKITYIEFSGTEHVVDVTVGSTLMEGARDNNVPGIDADCGGACACSTCHGLIDLNFADRLEEKSDIEIDMLDFASDVDPDRSRLTCQIRVTAEMDGVVVNLPEHQG